MIGGIIMSESPFSAVQLLWINLIMDTFAAIALSTEPPISTVTTGAPIKNDAKLMTPAVWRQVIGMTIWNTLIMTCMFVSMICSENYVSYVPKNNESDDVDLLAAANYKKRSLTNIYNTFVFLQIFNFINCRKVGSKDFNVFEKFTHNYYFLGVLAFIFGF